MKGLSKPSLFLAVVIITVACNTAPYKIADQGELQARRNETQTDASTPPVILSAVEEDKESPSVDFLSPIPPANLWDEIEAGYVFAPHYYDDPRVHGQMVFLREKVASIAAIKRRVHLFLYYIYEQLRQRDMPLELAFLPAVESTYDPYAYSSAGAAGLWQFTRPTGYAFGLKENWWHSQRRDLEASTQAALNYLEQLYARYANWELALAAYNAGPTRVDRAIAYNERHTQPTDYWHLRLPRETQHYVPRLIAYSRLFSAEYRAHLGIAELPATSYWVKVSTPRQISFRELIERADLDEEEFFLLNAEHNQWLSSPAKEFLFVARQDAQRTREALKDMSQDKAILWMGYRVGYEENMNDIAEKFGIADMEIQRVNDVDSLRSGNYVILPLNLANLANSTMDGLEMGPPQSIVRHHKNVRHYVRAGDTLWSISKAYGLSIKQLMRLNGLRSSRIRSGQELIVAESILVDEPAIRLADDYNRKVMRSVFYRVRRGDSLHSIADKFNVDVSEVRKWNGAKIKSRYIYPGQGVRLHIDVTDL